VTKPTEPKKNAMLLFTEKGSSCPQQQQQKRRKLLRFTSRQCFSIYIPFRWRVMGNAARLDQRRKHIRYMEWKGMQRAYEQERPLPQNRRRIEKIENL
jgi:hypothetical protein